MKRYKFLYEKTDEVKDYDLLILNSTPERLYGLDLNKLQSDEIEKVKEIQKKYEEEISPFVKKAYRQFVKEKIKESINTEIL